jgi:hypothetical protein
MYAVRTEEGDGADDATADSSGVSPKKRNLRIDSHISIMGTDNIMGRLTRLGKKAALFHIHHHNFFALVACSPGCFIGQLYRFHCT